MLNKKILILIILFLILTFSYNYYYHKIEYYSQIKNKRFIKDFTRWILCDKYIAKKYAEMNNFKVAKTYQLVKYPHQINFENLDNCAIKPVDLCDSYGVYLIKNGKNLSTNETINKNNIVNNLQTIRSKIKDEYYMHEEMYNGLVPYTGYIVEELLLDENGNIPSDYKCYVFGGKIYYIAMTYNRKKNLNNKQTFNSIWFTRDWEPIKHKMIKKNYKYNKNIQKPKGYDKMIYLVESVGKKLNRHCRIDVYLINGEVYFGEFTFFCGAFLHTFYCNLKLGLLWLKYPDNYQHQDNNLKRIVPDFYNQVND